MDESARTGAPKPPLTKRGRRTRALLIDAAEQVFGAQGFERASIADITRLAGVAQGTFYIYFPDKEAILLHLVTELADKLRARIHASIAEASERFDVERAGFRAFFEFCRDHRNLYRIVRQAEFVNEQAYQRYYRDLARGYVRGLEDAVAKGQIRPCNAEKVAYALMGIGDFLGMRWILWESDCDIEELVEEAMALIERGLRPD